ncbi:MAG: DUF2797 domain-containing protein [Bacteroidota bacterium]
MQISGQLTKMRAVIGPEQVEYQLMLNGVATDLNQFIGSYVRLRFLNEIRCVDCGKMTKSSFAEGFCYSCFSDSANNSPCIIRPELCEGHLGKGRDIDWEKNHHVQEHAVYLAMSSEIKVGVTRSTQVPTRWIDQGATAAIVLARVPYRQLAGVIEVALKEYLTDKTSWQKMLKNEVADFILDDEKWRIADMLPRDMQQYICEQDTLVHINYPVLEYPKKVVSMNFTKIPDIEGRLMGIKGQYLLFDNGRVLNIRSHSGYVVEFSVG